MVKVTYSLKEFLSNEYDSISMGLTPSGDIHLGTLFTFCLGLFYLKEHKRSRLVITTVENSTDSRKSKYNYLPLKVQYLNNGQLTQKPTNWGKVTITDRVHRDVKSLMWQLTKVFDKKTRNERNSVTKRVKYLKTRFSREIGKIRQFDLDILQEKENAVFTMFSPRVRVLSFLHTAPNHAKFVNATKKLLRSEELMRPISRAILGTGCYVRREEKIETRVGRNKQETTVTVHSVPIYLYCPDCNQITSQGALYYPLYSRRMGPYRTEVEIIKDCLVASCKNQKCLSHSSRFKPIVVRLHEINKMELHYLFNSYRDFFDPFKADAHIFGGDYGDSFRFGDSGKKSVPPIQKVAKMFEVLEQATGEKERTIYIGGMITREGQKLSKSDPNVTFKISEVRKLKKLFANIVKQIEALKEVEIEDDILRIEYENIIRNAV
jgi:hypothetical protein